MVDKFLDPKEIYLAGITGKKSQRIENISKKDIAVIGMSGRIASAESIDELWEGLADGRDFIRDFPEGRKNAYNRFLNTTGRTAARKNPGYDYVQGGYLEAVDEFDHNFFGISPKEAELMDPCQRIFLEAAWAAIEDAGYGGGRLKGSRTGVYVGHSSDFGEVYKRFIELAAPSSVGLSIPGNIKSIIASRISYLLDLKGPSMIIDTACSSSLVAIHLACQGIRNNECDCAIAGGVKVNLFPVKTEKSQDGIGIESSDGKTKTFDNDSDGTGVGEGAGAILLKPLNRALDDGDHIYAVSCERLQFTDVVRCMRVGL